MSGPADLTIAALRNALRAGELTALEVTEAYLDRIADAAPLNAYITVTADEARRKAAVCDANIAAGNAGPLEGIPLGIKDLFCTKGIRTTAASKMLENFVPPYESAVTENLWRDGAVCLGKLNMDEFAMGSSSETGFSGPVVNPWRRRGDTTPLSPGGSSGGSSAAVAARLCAGATGTDTGGSIRQPASMTGTVGVKPTYGRCSRRGIVAFASSLDQAGPVTRTVLDAAILLKSMAGHDSRDSTSATCRVPDFESFPGRSARGLKIGIPAEYRIDSMERETGLLWEKGMAALRDAGCEITDISLPLTQYAMPAYYVIAPAEASSNLARYDGVRYGYRTDDPDGILSMYENTRAEGFGEEVKRRILIGTYVLSAGYYDAYYLRAQKVRKRIYGEFSKAFEKADLILTPSTPTAAFALGTEPADPVTMYLNDIFTVTANLAGLPAASVPAGCNRHGLPLGLQLLARPFDEETMFRGMHVLEQSADFSAKPDEWWRTA